MNRAVACVFPPQADDLSSRPLRGRAAELALIDARLAALAAGSGGVVVVEGAPGAGKTRLLAEISRRAGAAGIDRRCATGVPDSRMTPFGALFEALLSGPDPVLDEAVLRGLTSEDQRFWVLQEIQERLEKRAAERPLVVLIDDAHRCDAASLLALRTLPQRLAGQAILWVLALRPGSLARAEGCAPTASLGLLAERLRETGAVRLELGALPDDAVAALARDVLGADADANLLCSARRAQGNPLLLVELLRGLRDERGPSARPLREGLPLRFGSSIRHRLDELAPSTRDAVRIAAALGRTVTVGELAALLDVSALELTAATREAVAADLLVDGHDGLVFRHDLIRQAVAATLPAALRRSLRRRAVDVRLDQGQPPARVAAELAATALPGDHRAVELLRGAAADLAPHDPAAAAAVSRRALELSGPAGPQTADVVGETVMLLWRDGQADEARALADRALSGRLEPEAEARVRLGVARLSGRHSFADAVRECRTALDLPGLSTRMRAALLSVQALNLSLCAEIGETDRAARLAEAEALACGDRVAEATALAASSVVALYRGDLAEAFRLQHRAVGLAASADVPDARWIPESCWHTLLLGAAGRTGEGLREAEAGIARAQKTGQAPALCLWTMTRARLLLDAGRLADAKAEAEAGLAMSGDLGSGVFTEVTARYVLGRVALAVGDKEGIRRCAADGTRFLADPLPAAHRTGAWMAALAADAEDDSVRALDLLSGSVVGGLEPCFATPPDLADLVVFTRIAMRAGAPERAAQAVAELDRLAARNPDVRLVRGLARHARALLQVDGDLAEEAVALLADAERRPLHASAAEDAGRLLALGGDTDRAVALLDAALDRHTTSGAAREAARVRRRLRGLGVRRPSPAERGGEGPLGLTPAELDVVRLVAEGATNREAAAHLYLSPHTVSSHLRHAFQKLAVVSRVELTRLVLDRPDFLA
ncbi:regulatory LuxR family protein [Actinocorallia herbida]|uniref:Regulatory LuxR family protein n=1 Tax=Actinocorallia herbida TaxID=58109 RepID=A0A3N1CVP7_9ACTN|nr:LuxR family transcriptional regulator [Actinocorallia herbida]ROO85371.1 regulatory LuxR family protein [Actinocorallia herbida]